MSVTTPAAFAKNVGWSLIGKLVPIGVAVACIPILINGLGLESFGILSVVWLLIGQLSLLDFGVPRAVIHLLSKRDSADTSVLVATSSTLILTITAGVAVVLGFVAPWLANDVFQVKASQIPDAIRSIWIVALVFPLITVSGVYRGVLEYHHDFKSINLLQIIAGILGYGLPAIYVGAGGGLVGVVGIMSFVRLANSVGYVVLTRRLGVTVSLKPMFNPLMLRELVGYTSWIALTNFLSPLAANLDRILIASYLTMTAVSLYAAPLEVITKLGVLIFSITTVLFPVLSRASGVHFNKSNQIYERVGKLIMIVAFMASYNIILLSDVFLGLWLGESFSGESALLLRVLGVSLFMNALAQAPFSYLQSSGFPKVTAKVSMIQAPLMMLLVALGLYSGGLLGAAIARTVSLGVDAILLTNACSRSTQAKLSKTTTAVTGFLTILLAWMCIYPAQSSTGLGLGLAAQILIVGLLVHYLFDSEEKRILTRLLQRT
jgi:O-antigen/teichoic acid export membrane protein